MSARSVGSRLTCSTATSQEKICPDTRVVYCPKFTAGSKREQNQILSEAKKKIGICKCCLSYTHQSDTSRLALTCKTCNRKHLTSLHDHVNLLSCSLTATVTLASMSMQDIDVKRASKGICVLLSPVESSATYSISPILSRVFTGSTQ